MQEYILHSIVITVVVQPHVPRQRLWPGSRPMAPSTKERRAAKADAAPTDSQNRDSDARSLFVDPMLGAPLSLYIDNDVGGREQYVQLVKVSIPTAITCLQHVLSRLSRN